MQLAPTVGPAFDDFLSFGDGRARNDLYDPEFITLMISVMNSRLWRSFQADSDRHRTMKNRQIRVLKITPSFKKTKQYDT